MTPADTERLADLLARRADVYNPKRRYNQYYGDADIDLLRHLLDEVTAERDDAIAERDKIMKARGIVDKRLCDALNATAAERDRAREVVGAATEWSDERFPRDPGDAELMKAIWRYHGDQTTLCEGCDGDCGEACAPCTVESACAKLDRFIAKWRKARGFADSATPPAGEQGTEPPQ
jgi:hypothetical protein